MVYYLFSVLLTSHVIAYNVDVKSPYVIKVPTSQEGSLFGFSTALHRWNDRGTTRKYILVGAPRANWTGDATYTQPGAIYKCPLDSSITNPTNEATCTEQVEYISSFSEANEDKNNQWLGVNVESSDQHVTACAHRYMYTGQANDKMVPIGQCIVVGPSLTDNMDDIVQRKVLYPCRKDTVGITTDSCQVGASLVQYAKGASSFMFYGGPGVDTWEGGAFLNHELNSVSTPKDTDKIKGPKDFNQYSGYSVAMCDMQGKGGVPDLITAAPRANNYLGMVYFFYATDNTNERILLRNSKLTDELTGDQMGAYYGYSMACGDLNNDGYDDLLVSAPWYSLSTSTKSAITSVGRVYVYNGDPNKLVSNANRPTVIDAPSVATSAFGLGLAHIGDVNDDGYQDFAIGAPYEDDFKGAIYIYHGSINGIKKNPVQTIKPRDLGSGLGANLKSFGWSISANKDMDDNFYPDMAVGSYMSDRVVYLRSLPIIDLNIVIAIPDDPVDLTKDNMVLPGSATKLPGTTLKICFTPNKVSNLNSGTYTVNYKTDLDYKQSYAPRAFFQRNSNADREFSKSGSLVIDVSGKREQCTDTWPVYLKKEMFDDKSYIEVAITANAQETDDIAKRAVLKQEQVSKAKGRIVIKSICEAVRGICDCDIGLEEPTVSYVPAQYDQIVINKVKLAIIQYEVVNNGPDNAYVPTLRLELPPKVTFIRRVPVGTQSESDVSQIACSEIEEDGKNYVECYLEDPLRKSDTSRFGLALDTSELTDTTPITLKASVSVGMPSEESEKGNNSQEITLDVGQEANLEIRGTAATEKHAIKPDTPADDTSFLRNIKLTVRHTVYVSVLTEESDIKDSGVENGIDDIKVEISWPMRDANGNNLLYLSEVYVKDNYQIKGNFAVDDPRVIDPGCHFDYNNDCEEAPQASAVEGGESDVIALDTSLNTNCSVPDPGCVTFNITIKLLKAGSINMKSLAFEMRSVIWLPTVLDSPAIGFNATSTARIVAVGQNLVIPPGRLVQMNTQVYQETKEQQNVVMIIIGAVIGGIVILAILIAVLWKIGFFKRKMPPRDGSS